jgi:hypothetical protein
MWREGQREFIRMNSLIGINGRKRGPLRVGPRDRKVERTRLRRRQNRCDDGPYWSGRRVQLRRDLLRLALREVEEPRQDGGDVVGGGDLRKLHDARKAEPAVPERLHHFGVALEELRRRRPVEGSTAREAQVVVQVVEERRVPELDPSALPVEVRKGDEEDGEGVALLLEQLGEMVGEFACVHESDALTRFGGLRKRTRSRSGARTRARPADPSRAARASGSASSARSGDDLRAARAAESFSTGKPVKLEPWPFGASVHIQ